MLYLLFYIMKCKANRTTYNKSTPTAILSIVLLCITAIVLNFSSTYEYQADEETTHEYTETEFWKI